MSSSISPVSALFTLAVLMIAATSAIAQVDRVKPNTALACCKCLGGTNSLDLSTISSNNWTVNNNPVVFLTPIHQLWNINPGPAKWVSTVPSGGTGSINAGTYDYKLRFVVPACAIKQSVTLSGNYGGDDDVYVYLDNTTNLISKCTQGWCFNTQNQPQPFSNYVVTPGSHTLIVRVINSGPSPSGMFINANLTALCSEKLTRSPSYAQPRQVEK